MDRTLKLPVGIDNFEKEEKKKRLEYAGKTRFIRRFPDRPSA